MLRRSALVGTWERPILHRSLGSRHGSGPRIVAAGAEMWAIAPINCRGPCRARGSPPPRSESAANVVISEAHDGDRDLRLRGAVPAVSLPMAVQILPAPALAEKLVARRSFRTSAAGATFVGSVDTATEASLQLREPVSADLAIPISLLAVRREPVLETRSPVSA